MKVLIYAFETQLAPVGGPKGYLYNLKKEIDAHHDAAFDFIKEESKHEKWKSRINNIHNKYARKFIIQLKNIYKYGSLLYGRKHYAQIDFSHYDIIHFHSSLDMYSVRDSLYNYKGKVVLTSHSPTLLSLEIVERATFFEKIFYFFYGNLKKIDMYAFDRANYFIFPCPEAEEPYYHSWKGFSQFKLTHKENFHYVLTGINPCTAKVDRETICNKYGIPNESIILSYVGRHNKIKGYDLLKTFAELILEKYKNVYFLIAGKEEPLKGLDNKRWIEVGWTNDPYSIIAASDTFILPNRETYFDLIMLEVLSLGKIVIASNTGGNKHFKNVSSILLYNNQEEALNSIEKIINMAKDERLMLSTNSLKIFNESFTCNIFYNNYKNIITSIYKDTNH